MNAPGPARLARLAARRLPVQIALLAAGYFLLTQADELLRIPSAAASPIWPAAGLALAALLVGGLRLWPGVLLGHFAFSLAADSWPVTGGQQILPEILYAIGPTCQALLGAYFVRRQQTGLVPALDHTVIRTMFLAGPVACLVAATWGTAGLALQGVVEGAHIASTWVLWWFGDTTGVLLVTPLILSILPGGQRFWPARNCRSLLQIVAAGAILLPGVYWYHETELSAVRKPLTLEALRAYEIAADRLNAANSALLATRNYVAASDEVTESEFTAYARRNLRKDLRALGWIPRVAADERGESLALLYAVAPAGQSQPWNTDIASTPRYREMLAQARDAGRPVASEPTVLDGNRGEAIFVFVPVYREAGAEAGMSIARRRELLEGFVVGAIDPVAATASLAAGAERKLAVSVTYGPDSNRERALLEAGSPSSDSEPLLARAIPFYGQRFQVTIFPAANYWHAAVSLKALAFLLVALLATFLISEQTLASSLRARVVRLKVIARTREVEQHRRHLNHTMQVAQVAGWSLDLDRRVVTLDGSTAGSLDATVPWQGGQQLKLEDWVRRFIHPEDAAKIEEAMQRAAGGPAADGPLPLEIRALAPSGEIRHLLLHVAAEPDRDGRVSRLVGTTQDITERKNTEIALRESEQYSRSLLQSSSDCIMVLTPGGRVVDRNANGGGCLIASCLEVDCGGDWLDAWASESDRDRAQAALEQAAGGGVGRFSAASRSRDGLLQWWDVVLNPVMDVDGKPRSLLCVMRDITEQRDAQARIEQLNEGLEQEVERRTAELLASERRYRDLFEHNPMPMWTYDFDTLAITSVNEAAIQHYGYSRDEFLRMTIRDIRPPAEQANLDRMLAQRQPGFFPGHTAVHRKKDGSTITVEVTSHEVMDDERRSRLVLANDVTERNRALALVEGQKSVLESITAGTTIERSLATLARLAEAGSPGLLCSVMVADPDSGKLVTAAAPTLGEDFARAVDEFAARDDGFPGSLGGCPDAFIAEDARSDERLAALRPVLLKHDLRACWTAPILDAGGEVIGAVVLYYGDRRRPRSNEIELVDTLARTAALAITRDRETRRLEDSEARFRATFESAGIGIIHVGLDDRILRANPNVQQLFGYGEAELRKMTGRDLTHPDDREVGREEGRDLIAGRIPEFQVEKRYVTKDGRIIWASVTLSVVQNWRGKLEYAIALVEDITWRKSAEAELHRQQEINRLLLENLSEAVVACDENGELFIFNGAARQWHGADIARLPRERWRDFYDLYAADGKTPLGIDEVPLARAYAGEKVNNAELCLCRHGEPPRFIEASGGPLLDADGEKHGAVVIMHDVTMQRESMRQLEDAAEKLKAANAEVERERASLARRVAERTAELTAANRELAAAKEAAEEASRAKSAFLATMSHEIRTPMNGILGMADILSESRLSENQQDAVYTIRDSSFTLLRLIDDILDFSKVEAGRLELEHVPLSVEEAVESVCDSLTPKAIEKDVDLELYVEPEVPEWIMGDSMRLRQMLYNLLGNAIKFSSGRETIRGSVQVRVRATRGDKPEICFDIVDNGVGIDAAVMEEIFESFKQAEVSTTRRFGGSGLGLAITKRLVELMQGRIDVDSKPEHGSVFTIRLPLDVAETPGDEPGFDLHGIAVRFEDRDQPSADALANYLEAQGAALEGDGEEASAEARVIVRHVPDTAPSDEEIVQHCEPVEDAVYLVITRGPRVHARILAPHVVVLQACAIRRRDFLRGVSVAAGRTSPEVSRAAGGVVRGQLVAPTVSQARTDGRLILVAEDDPVSQKVILRQLSLLGYAGEVAADGTAALEMWEKGSYALLLTDLHMPEMDGYELTRCIREREGNAQRMPILALTANALRGERERALAAGFDAYLTKPLQLSVLGDTLSDWIPAVRHEDSEDYRLEAVRSTERAPAIELGVLEGVVGGDIAMMCEFLNDYLATSAGETDELRSAIASGDNRQLAHRAHRQKGAARAVGALRLGDTCAELENAARADDEAEIRRLLDRFESQSEAVAVEIGRLMAGLGTRQADATAGKGADGGRTV